MSGALSNTATRLPAAALRPYITHYAGFCISGLPPGTFIGLPSRNITLIISFVEPIEILRMPNKAQRPDAYRALVAGLQDAPGLGPHRASFTCVVLPRAAVWIAAECHRDR